MKNNSIFRGFFFTLAEMIWHYKTLVFWMLWLGTVFPHIHVYALLTVFCNSIQKAHALVEFFLLYNNHNISSFIICWRTTDSSVEYHVTWLVFRNSFSNFQRCLGTSIVDRSRIFWKYLDILYMIRIPHNLYHKMKKQKKISNSWKSSKIQSENRRLIDCV